MLPSVRPLMQRWSCGPVWEFADRNQIIKACSRHDEYIWFLRPRLADCCAIPSFDRLHLRRPQVRQDHALAATGALYVSRLTSKAHTIRAILLASATVTTMRGLRASICSSQEPLRAPRLLACFSMALLPMMSRRLSVRSHMELMEACQRGRFLSDN